MREFESQPKCANIPLAGYMLDIVQRITRYKLLLSGELKCGEGEDCCVFKWEEGGRGKVGRESELEAVGAKRKRV